jgi:hypothetical protein
MNKLSWLRFLSQYTQPIEEWHWDHLGFNGKGNHVIVIDKHAHIAIHVRPTSMTVEAEILDISDEDNLIAFRRAKEYLLGEPDRKYHDEVVACIPWEEILYLEVVVEGG